MAQLSPSTTLYAQALALIQEFKSDYIAGRYASSEEVTQKLNDVVSQFGDRVGKPLTKYMRFEKGEPPISAKMNMFIRSVQNDVNILQEQVTLSRASTVFIHNYIATEIKRAQNENAQASNKLKTLQLYSTAHDESISIFGDYFKNKDFMDLKLISNENQASLIAPGTLTLGRDPETNNLSEDAEVTILASSNGFLGNNQEVQDPAEAPVNEATGDKDYVFKATIDRHAEIESILDGEPDTWIEYEVYKVADEDRDLAKGFNFVYRNDADPDLYEIEDDAILNEDNSLLDWAGGPRGNDSSALRFDLEFDLQETKTINTITYTPYGLEENRNHPVKVVIVQTSADGTDWLPVEPQNVWIGTDANLQAARAADNVVNGSAIWAFDQRIVRYVRIKIEQPRSIQSNIGHLFYESTQSVTTEVSEDDGGDVSAEEEVAGAERLEGPIPPLSQPDKYYGKDSYVRGNLVQDTEVFQGKRWAIGVRDILIEEVKYKEQSVIVSKPFRVNGVIDRVALDAEIFIPSTFPTNQLWVRFYISPDDGLNWYPISRIQDDYFGVPEIVAFNDPLPRQFHEIGVQYYNVNNTVDKIRLKIELTRPGDLPSSTPIVYNYKLKVRKR